MYGFMYGFMYGWMDVWMNVWMDVWTAICMDGCMDVCRDAWMYASLGYFSKSITSVYPSNSTRMFSSHAQDDKQIRAHLCVQIHYSIL